MALGLTEVKKRPSQAKPAAKTHRKNPRTRPWQASITRDANFESQPTAADWRDEFNFEINNNLGRQSVAMPLGLEGSTSIELVGALISNVLEDQWRDLKRRSYFLSRLTHQRSWLARLKVSPELRIPLPSFMTRKSQVNS